MTIFDDVSPSFELARYIRLGAGRQCEPHDSVRGFSTFAQISSRGAENYIFARIALAPAKYDFTEFNN